MSKLGALVFRQRRTVAQRILYSYLAVLLLFSGAASWSVLTFRQAVAEAALLRQGYLPLALSLRDLVSSQDTYNSQLNHVTAARNPADARAWFDTELAVGRPKELGEVHAALASALRGQSKENVLARRELGAELARIKELMSPDGALLKGMFAHLERGEAELAQVRRDELVGRGLRVKRALGGLERRVTEHVDGLVQAARARERTALLGLPLLLGLTLLVGVLMALYARRVLAPLGRVAQRADAVAAGDLSPLPPIDSGDEIGELSATFEAMVRAIGEARERVLASERLAAIGKMAAHVTHEVRNPLSSIALNLELLVEELPPDNSEALALVRAIGQEVQRLSGLSDQYLSMARRKRPEFEISDLGALARAAVDFMVPEMRSHRVSLDLHVAADLPQLSLDQGQVRQVLFNLVRNAREAMPDGGSVVIDVSFDDVSVQLSVTDDGPGVPTQGVEQLFDPFFTTKNHGTGLGLAVSRQILAAHGGELYYQPGEPRGSVFVLKLLRVMVDADGTGRADTRDKGTDED